MKLTYWRSLAILAVAVSVGVLLSQNTSLFRGHLGAGASGGIIARIVVDGVIADQRGRDELIEQLAKDKRVKAVLVRFDSPGGTTVGGEELYEQLRLLSKTKPVISVFRTVCASACYMAALGTSRLYARETSLTGSIGVLMQSANVGELAKKIGIEPLTITGGKYKDSPSMFKTPSEDELSVVRPLVEDTHAYFIGLVKTHRGITGDALGIATDGRVFTGRQALNHKLIDAIGSESDALFWLKTTKNIRGQVHDYATEDEIDELKKWLKSLSPLEFLSAKIAPLDGMVSIWHLGSY